MSYSLKNAKWLVLKNVAFKCTFLPSNRFYPTNLPQFLFSNSIKKIIQSLL